MTSPPNGTCHAAADPAPPIADLGMRIADRSTRGNTDKPRWTELSVWLRPPTFNGFRWTALIVGRSTVPGESDRVSRLSGDTLAQVLTFFDNSAPARSIRDKATTWAALNADLIDGPPLDLPFTGTTDEEALVWLYGAEALAARGINTRIGEDFGMGESSVRMARKSSIGLRVPLAEVARYIDRAAFQKARDLRAAMKEEASRG